MKKRVRRIDPANADLAAYLRSYARELHGGEEPDWFAIAGTLFMAAFETAEKVRDDERRRTLLRRVHEKSYDGILTEEPTSLAAEKR